MELKALKLQLQENTVKLKGGFTLDINLERNRTNEMSYEMTNKTQKLDSRIDSEISNVKALLEQFKADCIRYIAGKYPYQKMPKITIILLTRNSCLRFTIFRHARSIRCHASDDITANFCI